MRRRRRPLVASAVAEGDDYGWLMTFSDLVLQLFAFVVVCAVFGRVKPNVVPAPVVASVPAPAPAAAPPVRVTHARRSVAPVRPLRAEEPPPAPTSESTWTRASTAESTPARVEPPPARADAPLSPDAPPPAAPAATALRAAADRLEAMAGAQGVRVSAADDAVVVALQDAIGFASASADLLPAAAPILAEVRRLATAMPDVAIEVVGHTDDRPIESPIFPSNLELSLARAARVARELTIAVADLATRVSASGAGPYRPVASNADPEGRARNRRVEIRLVPRQG